MTTTALLLLFLFQLKHFFADFPLQTRWMLGKFKPGWDFFLPLLAHCGVHFSFTFVLTVYFGFVQAVCLAVFNATVHFFMDRIKASPKYLGRFKSLTAETAMGATKEQWKSNDWFWIAIGIDQCVHHMTDILTVFWVVSHIL